MALARRWLLVPILVHLAGACDGGGGGAGPDASGDATVPADTSGPAQVTIRVHYDAGVGHRISLRGDGPGLTWTAGRDCTATPNNIWECTVDDVVQPFEAKPLVDDVTWARGANWRVAAGAPLEVYPHFFATTGRLVTIAGVHSTFVTADRDVVLYLPPSYDENPTKRYPLVFMHDGQNLFEPALTFGGVAWEIDAAMDTLVGTSGIEEAIIAGVYNTQDRIYEYTPTRDAAYDDGGGGGLYMRFLIEELKPMLDSTYRTDGGRAGLAGSSLGGLVSLYGCWGHPEAFDRCGVFSPSLWWDDNSLETAISSDPATPATKPLTIYLDSGDSGQSMDGMVDTAAMRDILVGKGFTLGADLHYVLGAGDAHNETAWAARAPNALHRLLQDPDRAP